MRWKKKVDPTHSCNLCPQFLEDMYHTTNASWRWYKIIIIIIIIIIMIIRGSILTGFNCHGFCTGIRLSNIWVSWFRVFGSPEHTPLEGHRAFAAPRQLTQPFSRDKNGISLIRQKKSHDSLDLPPTQDCQWPPGLYFLLVVSTYLKNISQIKSSPQVGVKKNNIWIHHLDF